MEILTYPCGTLVKHKLGKFEAEITAIMIRFNSVRYELTYFIDGEECTVTVTDTQFTTEPTVKIKIGFKQ